jgi:chromosome segregation ATPase
MAETYKVGERYYVPVRVTKVEKASEGDRYPITASFLYTKKKTAFNTFANEPDLLLTAEEVAGLLKTKADVMEVVSDSLQEENEELKAENEKLKAESERLNAWYMEANRTASEATEANDELKAKIAEIRTRNAELEAILKEVTATRDEAIKQNDDLKSELEDARHVNEYAVETARSKEKLIGEQRELMKKYGIVIDILIDKITALKKGERNG